MCDAVCDDTRARVLSSLALCRGDNFNLNKWSGGRHLCPRLVLFILDYSERTCAAVSSAGRVRCLLSRVNVFQNPSGIHQVVPDRRADRPTDRPTRPSDPSAWPFPPRAVSIVVSPRLFSVFALIYAITTRDAFSSSHASAFVILCPTELHLRARAANCGERRRLVRPFFARNYSCLVSKC